MNPKEVEMCNKFRLNSVLITLLLATAFINPVFGQSKAAATSAAGIDVLRGDYGRYRANNDLLFYHLDVRVEPDKKFLSGKNTIRFKMLKDDNRIQIDLHSALNVDKITWGNRELKYTRQSRATFIDFPETLRKGKIYTIDFYYSGNPIETGRFGGITFKKDSAGNSWVNTSCEGEGASVWFPNKDQWRDEVENMRISVSIPNDLTDVSNGKFVGKTDLGDGYARWNWDVQYPINNYDISMNIGKYAHFGDKYKNLPLDYFVLPANLEKAKKQFAQVPKMLEAYEHYFGEYPFEKDGYKLIEVPYAGMEHQSAVAYGNHFENGYYGRDWTGVGISPRFDFIIIHESGHEWFGNSVTAADRSDMWIHEGWTTYMELLYVEYLWGRGDAIKYANGLKPKVKNDSPVIAARGANAEPPEDQYFKGALFINTLRSVIDDDQKWFKLIHDFYQRFKYQTIMTEDVVAFFNRETKMNLTPVFNQYLRHTAIPTLELKFDEKRAAVAYRWKVDEPGFAMPVRIGAKEHWQIIEPTSEWKEMKTSLTKDDFEAATDFYYINVNKR